VASSVFFNNFASTGEQELLEDLVVESIRIYGVDVYYIPRNLINYDKLLGEDDQSTYTRAMLMEMYIESIDGFTGDGNFMSKFGLEIRDQVIFAAARRTFQSEVAAYTGQLRPNEGDLIYFPLNKKCFQIKFTDKFEMFFQLGSLTTWKMTCELFEYSNEVFNTGVYDIDVISKRFSNANTIIHEDNIDLGEGTTNFPAGANTFINFTSDNPFSENDEVDQ